MVTFQPGKQKEDCWHQGKGEGVTVHFTTIFVAVVACALSCSHLCSNLVSHIPSLKQMTRYLQAVLADSPSFLLTDVSVPLGSTCWQCLPVQWIPYRLLL